jgi:hypothetical protein
MTKAILMLGGNPEDWGFIPGFLDLDDPRTAKEQFDAHYVSGWSPFEGFTFDLDTGVLKYPGDPPMKALSAMIFRDELILLFDSGWVMVVQPDKSWEICRMD